jgi:type IV pilus assembly protein PilB
MDNRQLLDLFQARSLIDASLAEEILAEIDNSGKSVPELLADFQVIQSKDDVWPILASELGATLVDLRNWTPPDALLDLVPAGTARLHGAFPVNFDDQGLHLALVDPLNPQTVEDLRFALGREIIIVVAPDYLVEAKINECYGGEGKAMGDILAQLDSNSENFDEANAEAEANSAPIIRYVDLVLYQAIKEKASDIHFEPFEKDFKIRYRVDGALYEMAPPPVHLTLPILSRVKVMANLNIAERRIPQDGRIVKQIGEKQVDMRVSTLPTHHGESIVLRVLDRSSVNLSLENLGLPPNIYNYISETIEKPNGIFIVTGPTGAGKTTTLYAGLRRINTIDAKLLTAEDPNRIMIGEMRDKETATIAIQAALTGHLVLSTLHTNDAPGAVTRLIDMGCEPFLVAASLEGVLGQRLVRTICVECKSPYEPNEALLSQLGISPHELGDKQFYTGAGCEICGQSGYRGRAGLYELLNITEPIRELITGRAPSVVIKQKAIELGMNTLREDGLRNIYLGKTTIEEVLKYT